MSEKFALTIKKQREYAGITLREMAKDIGIDFTYLSKIENGKADPPSEETIRKIARYFEYPELELVLLAGKMPAEIQQDFLSRPPYQIAYLYTAMRGREFDGPAWFDVLGAVSADAT